MVTYNTGRQENNNEYQTDEQRQESIIVHQKGKQRRIITRIEWTTSINMKHVIND